MFHEYLTTAPAQSEKCFSWESHFNLMFFEEKTWINQFLGRSISTELIPIKKFFFNFVNFRLAWGIFSDDSSPLKLEITGSTFKWEHRRLNYAPLRSSILIYYTFKYSLTKKAEKKLLLQLVNQFLSRWFFVVLIGPIESCSLGTEYGVQAFSKYAGQSGHPDG